MQTQKSERRINKQGYSYRWFMLVFCVWISMGNYYNYDIPTALRNSFKEYFSSMFSENQFEIYFALLHSISSFTNIFTPFFSGKIRDKFGNRIAMITLLSVVSIGQFLFIKGLLDFNIYYIVIGRILISIGIEPCCAVQASLLSQYFKSDHIAFATGLCELFATFGTITVLYLAPKLAANFGLIIAVQSGSLANIISIFCCLIALIFDYHAEVAVYSNLSSQITAQDIQEERSIFTKLYLILIVYYAMLNSALLTFSNFSIGFLSERYFTDNQDAEEKAGELMAVVWAISSFLFPLFGVLIDRYHSRSKFNIAASILATSGIILVWYRAPFIAIILLGIAFAILYSSVWSSIIFLVDYQHLGIAYAYLLSAGNLALTILPLAVSALRVHFQTYYYSLMLLVGLAFCTIIIGIYIYYEDYENKALDGSEQEKKSTYSAIDNEY